MLQFLLVSDERLAEQAQAAALVHQNKSWASGMVDVDDQRQLSSPCRRLALRTSRKPLVDIRIQNERIPCR
jgi:hypothetical protein